MLKNAVPGLMVALVLAAAGCGTTKNFANVPRPPIPLLVTATVSDKGVVVSPNSFGAGPINLVVANQTGASHDVALVSTQAAANPLVQTGPINPQGTASFKATVRQGGYLLRTDGHPIKPALIVVGSPRPSSQNILLQP